MKRCWGAGCLLSPHHMMHHKATSMRADQEMVLPWSAARIALKIYSFPESKVLHKAHQTWNLTNILLPPDQNAQVSLFISPTVESQTRGDDFSSPSRSVKLPVAVLESSWIIMSVRMRNILLFCTKLKRFLLMWPKRGEMQIEPKLKRGGSVPKDVISILVF